MSDDCSNLPDVLDALMSNDWLSVVHARPNEVLMILVPNYNHYSIKWYSFYTAAELSFHFNPSGPETGSFRANPVNTVAVDVLAPCESHGIDYVG